MDWKNIILILVAVSQLGLGLFVLIRNPKNKINISFSLVPFALFLWVFSTSQFLVVEDVRWAEFLYKLKFSAGLLIAVFFQFFTIFFPYQKKRVNFLIQFLIAAPVAVTLLILLFLPQYAIESINLNPGNNSIVVNKIFWLLFSFSFTFCFAIAYIRLFYRLRESDGFLKIQLGYVLAASLIPTTLAWFFNISFSFLKSLSTIGLGHL